MENFGGHGTVQFFWDREKKAATHVSVGQDGEILLENLAGMSSEKAVEWMTHRMKNFNSLGSSYHTSTGMRLTKKRERPESSLRVTAAKHIFTEQTELVWRECVISLPHLDDKNIGGLRSRARYEVCFHEDDFRTPLYIRALHGHCSLPQSNFSFFVSKMVT